MWNYLHININIATEWHPRTDLFKSICNDNINCKYWQRGFTAHQVLAEFAHKSHYFVIWKHGIDEIWVRCLDWNDLIFWYFFQSDIKIEKHKETFCYGIRAILNFILINFTPYFGWHIEMQMSGWIQTLNRNGIFKSINLHPAFDILLNCIRFISFHFDDVQTNRIFLIMMNEDLNEIRRYGRCIKYFKLWNSYLAGLNSKIGSRKQMLSHFSMGKIVWHNINRNESRKTQH